MLVRGLEANLSAMPEDDEATRIAKLIQADGPASDRELERFLASKGEPGVVARLLRWQDPGVRFWAIAAAERFYSMNHYVKVLEQAAKDPDEAVSSDAVDRLWRIAPQRVQRLSQSMVSKLSSQIRSGEKVFWLWSLARLRAQDAIPAIEALRSSEPGWTKLARVADVVLRYLKEGEPEVLSAIENHTDHEHMEELCTLAWFVTRSEAARAAVAKCAIVAPDEECRRECNFALEKLTAAVQWRSAFGSSTTI